MPVQNTLTHMPTRKAVLTGWEMAELFVVDGLTVTQIGERANVDPARVTQLVRECTGLKPTELRIKCGWINQAISPRHADEIEEFVKAHRTWTRRRLVEALGIARSSLDDVIEAREIHVVPDMKTRISTETELAECALLYSRGVMTTTEIAKHFNTDEHTVRRRLDEVGIERRGWASRAARAQRKALIPTTV